MRPGGQGRRAGAGAGAGGKQVFHTPALPGLIAPKSGGFSGIFLSLLDLRGRASLVEFLTNCSINMQPLLAEQIIFFKINSW